jgi:flagellar biosynthesis/type III secretory pathway M-ring protein FliF/YscJ
MNDWTMWAMIAVALFLAFVVGWFVIVEVAARRRQSAPEVVEERDIDLDPLP